MRRAIAAAIPAARGATDGSRAGGEVEIATWARRRGARAEPRGDRGRRGRRVLQGAGRVGAARVGHRSILADPRRADLRVLNVKIKRRECSALRAFFARRGAADGHALDPNLHAPVCPFGEESPTSCRPSFTSTARPLQTVSERNLGSTTA